MPPSPPDDSVKLFLSYAREDFEAVSALYDRLDAHSNLAYAAELYGLGRGPSVDARIREAAARFGIDHAFDKAQVFGQQILVAPLDQHFARVEAQAKVGVGIHQLAFALAGNKEQAANVDWRIGDKVNMPHRRGIVEG